jgi:hypothetical protein
MAGSFPSEADLQERLARAVTLDECLAIFEAASLDGQNPTTEGYSQVAHRPEFCRVKEAAFQKAGSLSRTMEDAYRMFTASFDFCQGLAGRRMAELANSLEDCDLWLPKVRYTYAFDLLWMKSLEYLHTFKELAARVNFEVHGPATSRMAARMLECAGSTHECVQAYTLILSGKSAEDDGLRARLEQKARRLVRDPQDSQAIARMLILRQQVVAREAADKKPR